MKPLRAGRVLLGVVVGVLIAAPAAAQIGDNSKIRIARNFSAEYNAKVMAVPEDERAWPAIRDASARLPLPREDVEFSAPRLPTHEHWEYIADYCRAHTDVITELREALKRPHFGYIVSDVDDPVMARAQHEQAGLAFVPPTPSENPRVVDLRYPCIGRMRWVVRLLCADARVAAHEGDPARAVKNVVAIVNAARLVRQLDQDISELVAIAALSVASTAASDVVAAVPLTPEQLMTMAEAFERMMGDHHPVLRLDLSRDLLLDELQRMYEDDGQGDGRLTPAGIADLDAIGQKENPGPGDMTLQALLLLTEEYFEYFWKNAATRREVLAEFERMVSAPIVHAPMWTWEEWPDVPGVDPDDRIWSTRYTLLTILLPSLNKTTQMARRAPVEYRTTAVALRLHARAAAGLPLPADVHAMYPSFAPALPLDCFTGKPLIYQRRGGGFVIYSVGADRDDDGGRAADCPACASRWIAPARADEAEDADWVLWPVP